jgi:hypothetical protein
MKKILFLVSFLAAVFISQAQGYNAKIGTDTTLAVAGTKTYSVTLPGGKANIAFQTNVTKNSGTVAGTIVLKGSCDGGTNYATLATHTLTDASAVWLDTYNYNPCGKYQVIVTTTGTSSTTWQCWLLYR